MNIGRAVRRWAPVAVGLLLVGSGIACFNYTKPATLPHHQAWATEHGRPAPSDGVLWTGVGLAVTGGLALGFAVGGRNGGGVG